MTEFLYWVSPVIGLLREAPEHDRADSERHKGPARPEWFSIVGSSLRRWAIFPSNESGRET